LWRRRIGSALTCIFEASHSSRTVGRLAHNPEVHAVPPELVLVVCRIVFLHDQIRRNTYRSFTSDSDDSRTFSIIWRWRIAAGFGCQNVVQSRFAVVLVGRL
jgi:hypothetical protein